MRLYTNVVFSLTINNGKCLSLFSHGHIKKFHFNDDDDDDDDDDILYRRNFFICQANDCFFIA